MFNNANYLPKINQPPLIRLQLSTLVHSPSQPIVTTKTALYPQTGTMHALTLPSTTSPSSMESLLYLLPSLLAV